MNTCTLKTTIKAPCRGRTLEFLVPCELAAGHLGRCEAAKLQAAALHDEPDGGRVADVQTTH